MIGKGRSMEDCSRLSRGLFWLPITQWPKLNNTLTVSLSLSLFLSFHSTSPHSYTAILRYAMLSYKSKLLHPNYCITSHTLPHFLLLPLSLGPLSLLTSLQLTIIISFNFSLIKLKPQPNFTYHISLHFLY